MYTRSGIETILEGTTAVRGNYYRPKKMVVVYSKKTKEMVPFIYDDNGEVVILSTKNVDLDDLHVNTFYSWQLDLDSGYILV